MSKQKSKIKIKSVYDVLETTVRELVCPSFKIFHENVSQAGNGWGKFVLVCSKCKEKCELVIGSRSYTYQ